MLTQQEIIDRAWQFIRQCGYVVDDVRSVQRLQPEQLPQRIVDKYRHHWFVTFSRPARPDYVSSAGSVSAIVHETTGECSVFI